MSIYLPAKWVECRHKNKLKLYRTLQFSKNSSMRPNHISSENNNNKIPQNLLIASRNSASLWEAEIVIMHNLKALKIII